MVGSEFGGSQQNILFEELSNEKVHLDDVKAVMDRLAVLGYLEFEDVDKDDEKTIIDRLTVLGYLS